MNVSVAAEQLKKYLGPHDVDVCVEDSACRIIVTKGTQVLLDTTPETSRDMRRIGLFLTENLKGIKAGRRLRSLDKILLEIEKKSQEEEESTALPPLFPKPPEEPTSVYGLSDTDEAEVRLEVVERMMLLGYSGSQLMHMVSRTLDRDYSWTVIQADLMTLASRIRRIESFEQPILRWAHRQRLFAAASIMWDRGEFRAWASTQKLILEVDGVLYRKASKPTTKKAEDGFSKMTSEELDHFHKTGDIPVRLVNETRRGEKNPVH